MTNEPHDTPTLDESLDAAAQVVLDQELTGLDDVMPVGVNAGDSLLDLDDGEPGAEGEDAAPGKTLAESEASAQDDGEQPSAAESAALAKATQALDRIGLDSAALQESLSKEDFFEAGRRASEHYAKQQKEFERIRAGTAKASGDDAQNEDSASGGDENPGSSGGDSQEGQPELAPELSELLQPFREIDPDASEALEGVFKAMSAQVANASRQASAANDAIIGQAVASSRRELQKKFPELAQPDVWTKTEADAQKLIAGGGKYLEPNTLEGRISLAITDALKLRSSESISESAAADASPPPGGGSQDELLASDPLDAEIMGYLDS